MSRVFINYRRSDASVHANLLYDWIRERYGEGRVFKDVDSIAPGLDFVEAIEHAIDSSEVMLVVIGRGWIVDANGRRRLEDVDDYVRMEIATALKRNIRVIPVLVEGAEMPTSSELPEPLAALPRRHAFELSDDRARSDRAELLSRLDTILGAPEGNGNGGPAPNVKPETTFQRAPDVKPPLRKLEPPPAPPPPADAAAPKPTKSLVKWGWIAAGASVLVPFLAAAGVILGAMVISRTGGQRTAMGIGMIVSSLFLGFIGLGIWAA
jgi:TIR domain